MSDKKDFTDKSKNSNDTFCCIYCTERNDCSVLSVKKCLGEKCSFCETSEEKLHSNDAWSKRMNALDSVKQTEIAKKYYGGKNRGKNKRKHYIQRR